MTNLIAARDNVQYDYTGPIDMVTVECAKCHVLFGIPARLKKALRDSKETFYCPHGHSNYYPGETDEQRLERQLANAREDARSARASIEIERRSHAATKGQLTKARKRAAAGVCPCCHRTFQQVARHMASQHPDFDPEAQS